MDKKKMHQVIIVAVVIFLVTAFAAVMTTKRDLRTISDNKKQLEADNKQLKADNKQLKSEKKELEADNKQLKAEVAELTATSREQTDKIAFQEGNIEGLENLLAQAEKETKPKLLRFYNGKLTEMSFQADEMDAINHPDDIYQNVVERDIAFFISGICVKNVYVNQQKLENITYNEQEKTCVINYYMPGEGQYTFIVETDNGNCYFSVNY